LKTKTLEDQAALYSFAHPSEAELLKRFYQAGNTYSALRATTDAIDDYSTGPKTLIDSSYWKACCSAAEGLLSAYVHKVAAVESECLTEAEPLPLCYLWLQVEESVHDLEVVHRTFHDLASATSASSARDPLLSALHKKYTSHAGSGLRPLQALHAAVVSTFALHLQGWLQYGLTPHAVDDFFIQPAEHQQHALCAEKAPPFLSPTSAQKLLFIGRANMVLSKPLPSAPVLSPDWSLSSPNAGPASALLVPPAPQAVAACEPPLADSPLWARLHAVIAPPGPHLSAGCRSCG
jgi:hypothetical protein